MVIYHYCVEPGCDFTTTWEGGSAADDPSLPHLFVNPAHTVRSGVNGKHKRNYELQKTGDTDVTRDNAE
jgi:hypothetical protein